MPKVKAHARLLIRDLTGKPAEKCGSDSLVYLDGRCGLERHREAIREHINRLNKATSSIIGYRLYLGEFGRHTSPLMEQCVYDKIGVKAKCQK